MKKPFTSIKLLNGDNCEIFEVTAGTIIKAAYHKLTKPNIPEYINSGELMMILSIKINDQFITVEEFCELSTDDYMTIMQVFEVTLKKIPE